ncbi:MAG TPA: hypothetical protein VFL86_29480, partial [Burkholderiaceae bacterium]|nr:hypothetical protein [Burkholderiaceae bacterium]
MSPPGCVAGLLVLYATFCAFDYAGVVPNTYLPGWHYTWGAFLLLTLATGAWSVTSLPSAQAAGPCPAMPVPAWIMALLLLLTLFAYGFWFSPLAANPQILVNALAEGEGNIRKAVSSTPGVTTMTQCGVAYVIGYAIRKGDPTQRMRLWEHLGLAAVLVAGLIRVVAWSERLALIELVVCGAVSAFAFVRIRRRSVWRLAVVMPLLAPPLLLALFAATEYFRSWNYYQKEYDSIWQFSIDRLLAYYATASNNGIGLLVENHQWPQYSGRYVAEWLYLMPGLGDWIQQSFGDVSKQYSSFLATFARPELNNPSGIFQVVFDVGYLGSTLYFLATGMVIGRLWLGWRRGELAGLLFYPPCALYLIELLRINYLASTRFFPAAVGLVMIYAA